MTEEKGDGLGMTKKEQSLRSAKGRWQSPSGHRLGAGSARGNLTRVGCFVAMLLAMTEKEEEFAMTKKGAN